MKMPIEARREMLARDILRFKDSYPLAKLLDFFLWASEPDSKKPGKMRCETQPSWSTGGRLLRYESKVKLPDNWEMIAPDFARVYKTMCEPQPELFAEKETVQEWSLPDIEPQALQQFTAMIQECKKAQRFAHQLAFFDAVRMWNHSEQDVTLAVPHDYVRDYIEKNLLGVMAGPFRDRFGQARLHWITLEEEKWKELINKQPMK